MTGLQGFHSQKSQGVARTVRTEGSAACGPAGSFAAKEDRIQETRIRDTSVGLENQTAALCQKVVTHTTLVGTEYILNYSRGMGYHVSNLLSNL